MRVRVTQVVEVEGESVKNGVELVETPLQIEIRRQAGQTHGIIHAEVVSAVKV